MPIKTLALLVGLGVLGNASAEVLRVKVVDGEGAPVAQAAVYAKAAKPQTSAMQPKPSVIDQVDKEFVNHVSVVQTGTPVMFPNHDKIRHHVYSFSEAKKFELPLYEGVPAKPVVFDKAGVVVLGCNIHDWMVGYVLVVDTPFFALTDNNGIAELALPANDTYTVSAWHPKLKKSDANGVAVGMSSGKPAELTLTISLKNARQAIRLPATAGGLDVGYR